MKEIGLLQIIFIIHQTIHLQYMNVIKQKLKILFKHLTQGKQQDPTASHRHSTSSEN